MRSAPMTNQMADKQDKAELIDLFFKFIKAPKRTTERRRYGAAFNRKLEGFLAEAPADEMRAFAREVSELGTIRYTQAFAEVVQLRGLAD